MSEELFEFAQDHEVKVGPKSSWKVLVVDDDEEVHAITKSVLRDFVFEDKDINLIHAYSASEAKEKLNEHNDAALILLDVVMETGDAGLNLVEYVRNELNNKMVRIVLRTGQPGEAPQKEVIVQFDINDYKEKTELSVEKLLTTVITSLRSYRDLNRIEHKREVIEQSREGLQYMIKASANLFEIHSLQEFAQGALLQLISILNLNKDSLYLQIDGLSIKHESDTFSVLAGTGKFCEYKNEKLDDYEEEKLFEMLRKVLEKEESMFIEEAFIGYFKSSNEMINILYVDGCKTVSDEDKGLIEIYSKNVAIAFENLYLEKEKDDTQDEVIQLLSAVVESRSIETINHVIRVSEYTYYLAKKSGLSEAESLMLKSASPLHDIGKVGIPDSVLFKRQKLTDEEFDIIKSHARLGYDILSTSKRPILKAAAVIAHEHHEKFDGSGYPRGLQKHDIHIYGRIVAIADVFDALSHRRCYDEAWGFDEAMGYIQSHKRNHFDPILVDLFFSDVAYVKNIMTVYSDLD